MAIVMLIVALPAIFSVQFFVPRLMPFVERFFHTALGHVRSCWNEAHTWEKCALLLFFVPIPGPVDEIIALLVVRRIVKRRPVRPEWIFHDQVVAQVAKDTCSTHGIFCCSQCFDMEPVA